jgi:hypothetical protein
LVSAFPLAISIAALPSAAQAENKDVILADLRLFREKSYCIEGVIAPEARRLHPTSFSAA